MIQTLRWAFDTSTSYSDMLSNGGKMTARSGLAPTDLARLREGFKRKVENLPGSRYAKAEAIRRLESRFKSWHGVDLPSAASRFKNKITNGAEADCTIGSDEAEVLIVRALGVTRPSSQFTVSPNGAVYASEGDGWTINGLRVYVSGLSELVDDAADILQQMRGRAGGRMYFTRENNFVNARTKRPFLAVLFDTSPATVLNASSASSASLTSEQVCPSCFKVLPRNGICDCA